jgi:hypothetical protein
MQLTSFKRRAWCAAMLLFLGLSTSTAFGLQRVAQSELQGEREALVATPMATSGSCGVERWSVKVGTDPDAPLVNLNAPTTQTISYMRGLTAPASPPLNARVRPPETTDFVIDATLTQYKLENDSDYHLVIKDAAGNTMIAEIPDPACVSTSSVFYNLIKNARAQFDAKLIATSSFQTANIPVRLSGVGFFDFLHGQTGVAPNGIELHPLINVVFNPGTGGSPDFALTAAPSTLSVAQASSTTSIISIVPTNGFTGNVTFAASGMPAGVTAAFSPASSTAGTTLTLTASAGATTGPGTVAVAGSNGSLTHTVLLSLTVNASSGGGTAVYSASLKAPSCTTVGASCDSGPALLLGRGTLSGGVEPNQPNTINASCADGSSGAFHTDESNDRLAIASTDGGPLTAGKTARITATVWSYSTSLDALDLYSAPNANAPTWTFLNTIVPTATGAQTLTTTFVLPTGGLQAIRAHFRYQGSASTCSTGAYDESDDLVFAVAPGGGAPDFSLGTAPGALTVLQGTSDTSTVTETSLNGFSAATPGSASVTVTGVAGSLSHTANVLLSVTASGGGSTQLLGNTGFETGSATPWVASTGVVSNSTSEPAHGGSWDAWMNGYGTAHTDTLSQQVTIPSGKTSATLSFYMHIDTAETGTTAYDKLAVQVTDTAGTVLGTLYTYSNLNKNTGYSVHNLTMTPYIGQTVIVKFVGSENSSRQTSFVLDDVTLNVQ